ncbi:RusA family crossover junction endodeoxyribonuclease [Vagococcus fluvialis]|uniref:RusA family crossover junction endodeoxyribonuclease n=1 Tax=Vagococcus fluvialis TaxID=2738 RepID=UPI002B282C17|nr:RusA family crossover junction endodeoxyribonuclease [Vagococcus fluvialis]
MEIKIVIPGQPVPQGRPKFTTKPFVRAYDPPKSSAYKKVVAKYANQCKPNKLMQGPLEVRVDIYKESLKSFSKIKKEQAENKELRPITKPDADNYAKGILDALKGIIWEDDGQVVKLITEKFYSSNPRAEVFVSQLESQQEVLF